MHRSISPTVLALAGVGALLSAGSCSGTVADPEALPAGVLAIQLQPGAAIQLEMLEYNVKRNGGFERKGPVAVAQANAHNTFAFKVEELPPAADYALAVNADAKLLSADALTHCRGGTSFGIDAGKSTAISLRIQCDGVPTTGSRVQTPDGDKVNECPVVQALRAVPAAAPVGMKVMLKADVQDAMDGPTPLNYAWSTASGTLSGTNLETSFTCTRAGVARITLALSDGDSACADTSQFVYVTCTDAACLAAKSCELLGDFPGRAGSSAPLPAGAGATDAARAGASGASAGAGGSKAAPALGQAGANALSQSLTPSAGTHADAGGSDVAGKTVVGGSGSPAAESGSASTGGVSGSPDLTPHAGDGEEHRNRTRNRRHAGAGGEGGNAAETSSSGDEEMAGASGRAGSAPDEAGSSGVIDVEVSNDSDAGSGSAGSE